MSDVYAKVVDPTYSIRRQRIPAGRIVHCTRDQLKAAKASNPARLEQVEKPAAGAPVIDIRPTGELVQAPMSQPAATQETAKGK